MSKHTQGPWSMIYTGDWTRGDVNYRLSSICHVGDYTIHTDYSSYDFHGSDEDDARLIAAAPDMLAALRLVSDLAHRGAMETGNWLNPDNPYVMVDAAIAKATGGATLMASQGDGQ